MHPQIFDPTWDLNPDHDRDKVTSCTLLDFTLECFQHAGLNSQTPSLGKGIPSRSAYPFCLTEKRELFKELSLRDSVRVTRKNKDPRFPGNGLVTLTNSKTLFAPNVLRDHLIALPPHFLNVIPCLCYSFTFLFAHNFIHLGLDNDVERTSERRHNISALFNS